MARARRRGRCSASAGSTVKDTFLSAVELVELRWVERNRWRFASTKRKEPRVAREHFNARMGCSARPATLAEAANQSVAAAQSNFAALDRR